MASYSATLLAESGVTRFGYVAWFWPSVGSVQVIGDEAKTYLEAHRAGWFSYAVADADADIPTPSWASRRRLSPDERAEARRILTSDPDVAGPLQIPRVADAAARTALTPVHDGDVCYQLDTHKFYIRAAGAWVIVPALDGNLGTAATKDTGTTSGTIPLLGAGGLPAVSGENLTGLTADQISGLGTATPSSTTTVSTGSVAASGTYDFTVAIPGATDRATIGPIKITATGDSTSLKLAAYTLDNRSDTPRFLLGEENSALTVDPGPVVGPHYPLSGGAKVHAGMPIINLDGTASVPFRLTNGSGGDSGAWTIEITLTGLPDAA